MISIKELHVKSLKTYLFNGEGVRKTVDGIDLKINEGYNLSHHLL